MAMTMIPGTLSARFARNGNVRRGVPGVCLQALSHACGSMSLHCIATARCVAALRVVALRRIVKHCCLKYGGTCISYALQATALQRVALASAVHNCAMGHLPLCPASVIASRAKQWLSPVSRMRERPCIQCHWHCATLHCCA
eukprot:5930619-Pyramimonas_sp.AAC.2